MAGRRKNSSGLRKSDILHSAVGTKTCLVHNRDSYIALRLGADAAETHLVSKPRLAVPAACTNTSERGVCAFVQDECYTGLMNVRLLFLQLYVLLVVAALHIVGTWLSLYWTFWWYDILVHFLASLWLGLLASWTSFVWDVPPRAWFVLGCVLVVGFGWEVFEYIIGATDWGRFFLDTTLDTALDVSINVVGGLVALFLARGQSRVAS
jgi:hypothetical protein